MATLAHHKAQDRLRELQKILNTDIPLTQSLGLSVASYDNGRLKLNAPLTENINHAGTAFAGSLNALVTLAGWSIVWLVLQECALQGEIVIQDCTCKYLLPVTTAFSATCIRPESNQLRRFEKTLRERGKARLELSVEIVQDGLLAVSFHGRYVVHGE